jgi:tryptophan synthase beta chain
MGIFHAFLDKPEVKLIGVEAGGKGLESNLHSAPLALGEMGVLHGARSYLLQDKYGQVRETHSISAGLDYPGVGPEHSYLKDSGRASYVTVTDAEALEGFRMLSEKEGIIPALESAHAVYYAATMARDLPEEKMIVVNLSGRGDKDLDIVLGAEGGGL